MTRFRSVLDLPAHYRDQVTPQPRATPTKRSSKYGNKRVEVDGKKFDSILEADYYVHLMQLHQAGAAQWFARQVSFDLPGGIIYRADFVVVDWATASPAERVKVIDTKGFLTKDAILKLKLMASTWAIDVLLVRRISARGFRIAPWR